MKLTVTARRNLLLKTTASLLVLAISALPGVLRRAESVFTEFVQIEETATQLPCKLIAGFRNFSLDRLDPTCPQCI